jgi:protein-L-isoaspartate(D-aspartate) O-methyltransferase
MAPLVPQSFDAAREHMVREQLERRGIRDRRVLQVMRAVPREAFASPAEAGDPLRVYADNALPAARGQTLSQPYMVAAMTEALGLDGTGQVLEIGTGTGYQTAVLAPLADEVWTVERDPVLAVEARKRLERLGVENVHFRVGDGSLGWPEGAPYRAILVTAGAPSIPAALVSQLEDGGRLVIPVGTRDLQELLLVAVEGDRVSRRALMECRFVPLVGEEGWRPPTA